MSEREYTQPFVLNLRRVASVKALSRSDKAEIELGASLLEDAADELDGIYPMIDKNLRRRIKAEALLRVANMELKILREVHDEQ